MARKRSVHQSGNSIDFVHELDDTGGYAYSYSKRVRLDGHRLILEHRLRNTGRKTISTSVNEHNFFMLDGQASGPDTILRFHFYPRAKADLHGLAETDGQNLRDLHELEPRRVFTRLFQSDDSSFDAVIVLT